MSVILKNFGMAQSLSQRLKFAIYKPVKSFLLHILYMDYIFLWQRFTHLDILTVLLFFNSIIIFNNKKVVCATICLQVKYIFIQDLPPKHVTAK